MIKTFKIFALALFVSSISHANILIPTFNGKIHDGRVRVGEQIYAAHAVNEILWQLGYWSYNVLVPAALSQALNDVTSDNGKFSGTVNYEKNIYNLYHASAGRDDRTATLFYIIKAGVACIVGIAKHVAVKACQPPAYEILGWDDRYTQT